MPLPDPVPGLVLHYSYLWEAEFIRGFGEGKKNRPCVIVLTITQEQGFRIINVVPISHVRPSEEGVAVEIPAGTKYRLGLDEDRSWIYYNEANRFVWPGFDLHPVPGTNRYDYGIVPPGLYRQIRDRFLAMARSRKLRITSRD